jgi:hypothetical protein
MNKGIRCGLLMEKPDVKNLGTQSFKALESRTNPIEPRKGNMRRIGLYKKVPLKIGQLKGKCSKYSLEDFCLDHSESHRSLNVIHRCCTTGTPSRSFLRRFFLLP